MSDETNKQLVATIGNIDLDPIFSDDLRKQIEQVGKAASKIPVKLTTAAELAAAEDVVKTARKLAKQTEDVRKTFSSPLEDKKKQLIALERSVTAPATTAAELLTKSINAYHNEQARIAREAAVALEQKAQAKLRRMSNPSNIAAVQQATEVAVAAVAAATTGTKKVKKWRVVNIAQVPLGLLMINDSKVQELIKAGATTCAGLEIYEEVVRSGR